MNHQMSWLQLGCLALTVAACGGTTAGDDPGDHTQKNAVADLLYVGACTPSDCDGQAIPALACAEGPGELVCSASNGSACSVHLDCPALGDPGGTTSFAPCDDVQCGPTPTGPEAACPTGYSWSAPQCGKLNGDACAWGNHCAKDVAKSDVDETKLGKVCDANSGPCDGTEQCVALPGVDVAHCVQDPCGLIGCPADKCISLDSYPAQVRCTE